MLHYSQVAGDMLFHDTKFDMAQVVDYFRLKGDGDLALLYEMEPSELTKSRGIAECSAANRSTILLEYLILNPSNTV